ncbi:MAG: UTP--glucose-1-phosphate uridylyltransferase [Armatimonadetes bacterium]|nr:MAG: UTP--glucose-1-phosphate uridylyltransferase [Armatimonadota bacterium]
MAVKTAVFPVAGLGTRFLPATKAIPKEMLPVVDTPLIQYAVEEALEAGIENLVFVTGRGKTAIEDHFDVSYELEATLRSRAETETLEMLNEIRLRPGQAAYVRQMEPLGLGHAVWCARHLIGDEPFAVLLADDLLHPTGDALKAMITEHEATGANIILVQEVDPVHTDRYGIITPGESTETATEVVGIVEKPSTAEAPSNLGVIGRYILNPSIMDRLASTRPGSIGEIQLTDGIATALGTELVSAVTNPGVRFDCGTTIGLIEATLSIALERDDISTDVRALVKRLG